MGPIVLAKLMESQIWHRPAVSVALWGKVQKGTMASACLPVPQLSPWCQTLRFLPLCHWWLSSCYPVVGAQREWVWISPCVGSLRGRAWDSRIFFYSPSPLRFSQPEVMQIYLPGTGTLGCGSWCRAGTPCSWDIPPELLSTTWVWDQPFPCLRLSYQSEWMWFL